jgi:hypothetical protein
MPGPAAAIVEKLAALRATVGAVAALAALGELAALRAFMPGPAAPVVEELPAFVLGPRPPSWPRSAPSCPARRGAVAPPGSRCAALSSSGSCPRARPGGPPVVEELATPWRSSSSWPPSCSARRPRFVEELPALRAFVLDPSAPLVAVGEPAALRAFVLRPAAPWPWLAVRRARFRRGAAPRSAVMGGSRDSDAVCPRRSCASARRRRRTIWDACWTPVPFRRSRRVAFVRRSRDRVHRLFRLPH